jgi:hypothetical protein
MEFIMKNVESVDEIIYYINKFIQELLANARAIEKDFIVSAKAERKNHKGIFSWYQPKVRFDKNSLTIAW